MSPAHQFCKHKTNISMSNDTQEKARPSSLSLESRLKPSFTFPGSGQPNFSYSGANRSQSVSNNLYTASVHGKYSRYGTKDTRPQRVSLNPASILDTHSSYQLAHQKQRRHSMGSMFTSTPLGRSPPVPTTSSHKQPFVWPSSDRITPHSPRKSFSSAQTEQNWNNNVQLISPTLTLKEYSRRLQDHERGVPMQERMVKNKLERVFTGADAIEWFITNMDGVSTVEKAQLTGSQLLKCGLIINVNRNDTQHEFLGSPNSLYKFPPVTRFNPPSDSNEDHKQREKPREKTSRGRCILQ